MARRAGLEDEPKEKKEKEGTTEEDLKKLIMKRDTLQAHLKSVSSIQDGESVCADIVQFISKHQAEDHLVDNKFNPFITVAPKPGTCPCTIL
jgi:hypothetical protein